jgi:hypothetical protein
MREFAQAMTRWKQAGYPVATPAFHNARYQVCLLCPERRGFWCSRCWCLVYLKSKLLTEGCNRWPEGS